MKKGFTISIRPCMFCPRYSQCKGLKECEVKKYKIKATNEGLEVEIEFKN